MREYGPWRLRNRVKSSWSENSPSTGSASSCWRPVTRTRRLIPGFSQLSHSTVVTCSKTEGVAVKCRRASACEHAERESRQLVAAVDREGLERLPELFG